MPCASLQRMPQKFQEESSDLETQLLELEFLFEAEYVNKLKESGKARTMFSVENGDHDVMKEKQIWIGIEIFPEKDETYTYDVYASQKELGARSILLYSDILDLNKFSKLKNKCFQKVFKKEIQMTK